MEHLSNDQEDHHNLHENIQKLYVQWKGASLCEFEGKSMKTETTVWLEFNNGGKAALEQIIGSEERKESKIAGLWE